MQDMLFQSELGSTALSMSKAINCLAGLHSRGPRGLQTSLKEEGAGRVKGGKPEGGGAAHTKLKELLEISTFPSKSVARVELRGEKKRKKKGSRAQLKCCRRGEPL